jgi:hypothetical protein
MVGMANLPFAEITQAEEPLAGDGESAGEEGKWRRWEFQEAQLLIGLSLNVYGHFS